jgi:predicted nucleotidyltransferase
MDIIIKRFSTLVRNKLKNHVKKIILFGSRSRGDSHKGSNYDFIVIVDKRNKKKEEAVVEVSGELLYEYSELIGPVVWDEEEWEDRKKYPIGINILKEGKEV